MSDEKMRQAFEAWAALDSYVLKRWPDSGNYVWGNTEAAWEAWQEATRQAMEQITEDTWMLRELLRNTQTLVCQADPSMCGDIALAMRKTAYMRQDRAAAIGKAEGEGEGGKES